MGFEQRELEWRGASRGYQVYVPNGTPEPWPSILFLHGMGESGADNQSQALVGLGTAIREAPEAWPFLTVFPQKAEPGVLWPAYRDLLNQILLQVEAAYPLDPARHFLTGLSQGGNGAFELLGSLAWRFAAIAPICGWADPRRVQETVLDTPMWIFHGAKDQAVPASCSQAIYDCLASRSPKNKKLTIFPDADHNSWDRAYGSSGLPQWFASFSRRV